MIITLTLPKNAHLKVKKGEMIDFGDPLYAVASRQEIKINIAERLAVKPEDIFRHVVKVIGERVKKGELIAKKKKLLKTDKIYSDYDGVIKEINHQTGEILLTTDKDGQDIIPSYFEGLVEQIGRNQLKIEVENGKEFELKEINADGGGEIFYFKEEALFFSITEEQIRNKIIVLEKLKSHIEAKGEALGCSGFVLLIGKLPSSLPAAKIKKIDDYQRIIQLNRKYVIYSKNDKKVAVYC